MYDRARRDWKSLLNWWDPTKRQRRDHPNLSSGACQFAPVPSVSMLFKSFKYQQASKRHNLPTLDHDWCIYTHSIVKSLFLRSSLHCLICLYLPFSYSDTECTRWHWPSNARRGKNWRLWEYYGSSWETSRQSIIAALIRPTPFINV